MNYSYLKGQKVVVELVTGDKVSGTLLAANVITVMLRPKGQTSPDLYEVDDIADLILDPAELKPIEQRVIKPIVLGQAGQHLADRHGWPIVRVKSMSEDKLFEYHDSVDHDHLSHAHVDGVAKVNADAQE